MITSSKFIDPLDLDLVPVAVRGWPVRQVDPPRLAPDGDVRVRSPALLGLLQVEVVLRVEGPVLALAWGLVLPLYQVTGEVYLPVEALLLPTPLQDALHLWRGKASSSAI